MLLIEQNLGVAIDVADRIGRDGQRPHRTRDAGRASWPPTANCRSDCSACMRQRKTTRRRRRRAAADDDRRRSRVLTVRRAHGDGAPALDAPAPRTVRGFNRWNAGDSRGAGARHRAVRTRSAEPTAPDAAATLPPTGRQTRAARGCSNFPVAAEQPAARRLHRRHLRHQGPRAVLPASQCLEKLGLRMVTVDLSTSGKHLDRQRASARGRAPPSERRDAPCSPATAASSVTAWRSRSSDSCSGGATSAASCRPAARAEPRWRRRQCARCRSACPKVMVSTDGLGRHASLRRAERHLHDVFGDRRVGHQPHQREGAGERRACAGRHDRAHAHRRSPTPSPRSG